MEYELKDEKIILHIAGRLSTDNVKEFEDEVNNISSNSHSAFIIDASDLVYISSAGLRCILNIAKKEKDFKITNVSQEVYEIFEMTGFSNVLNIVKKYRKISVDGAELIGNGFFSEVYRIDKETIVKVFIKNTDFEEAKKELNLAKQGFVLGLPTAISYDVVDVNGKPGLVFEMLDCASLKDVILNNLNKFDEYMKLYAELIKKINTTNIGNTKLPNAKDVFLNKIEVIKEYITTEEYEKIKNLVKNIPEQDTFIHGDCQIKNVMVNNGEFLLIDMETLSTGNPIFELASICACYQAFCEVQVGYEGKFLEIPNDMPNRIFNEVIKYYFEGLSEDEINSNINKIELVCYLHMMWWMLNNAKDNKSDFEFMKNRFETTIVGVNDLILK